MTITSEIRVDADQFAYLEMLKCHTQDVLSTFVYACPNRHMMKEMLLEMVDRLDLCIIEEEEAGAFENRCERFDPNRRSQDFIVPICHQREPVEQFGKVIGRKAK
jgi:hypothetical protein